MLLEEEEEEEMLVEGSREARTTPPPDGGAPSQERSASVSSVAAAVSHGFRLSIGWWRYELEHSPAARRSHTVATLPLFSSLAHVLYLLRFSSSPPNLWVRPPARCTAEASPPHMTAASPSLASTTSPVSSLLLLEYAMAVHGRGQFHALLYALPVTMVTSLLLRAGMGFGGVASPSLAQRILQRYVDTCAVQHAIIDAVEGQVQAEMRAMQHFYRHHYVDDGHDDVFAKTTLTTVPRRLEDGGRSPSPSGADASRPYRGQGVPSGSWWAASTPPSPSWFSSSPPVSGAPHRTIDSRTSCPWVQERGLPHRQRWSHFWWPVCAFPRRQWLLQMPWVKSSLSHAPLLPFSIPEREEPPSPPSSSSSSSSFLYAMWDRRPRSLRDDECENASRLTLLCALPHPSPFFIFIRLIRGSREVLRREPQHTSSTATSHLAMLSGEAPPADAALPTVGEDVGGEGEERSLVLSHQRRTTTTLANLSDPMFFASFLYSSVILVVKWDVAWRAFQALNRDNPWWWHPHYQQAVWITTTPSAFVRITTPPSSTTTTAPHHERPLRPSVPYLVGPTTTTTSRFLLSPEESEDAARSLLDILCRGGDPWMVLHVARVVVRYHLMDGLDATLWVLHRLDPSHHVEEAREVAKKLFYWLLADAGIHMQPERHTHLVSLARVLIRLQLLSPLRHLYNIFLDPHYSFSPSLRRSFMAVMTDLVCPECSALLLSEALPARTKANEDDPVGGPSPSAPVVSSLASSSDAGVGRGLPFSSLPPASQVYVERRCHNCMAVVAAKHPTDGELPSFALTEEHVARLKARRRANTEEARRKLHERVREMSGMGTSSLFPMTPLASYQEEAAEERGGGSSFLWGSRDGLSVAMEAAERLRRRPPKRHHRTEEEEKEEDVLVEPGGFLLEGLTRLYVVVFDGGLSTRRDDDAAGGGGRGGDAGGREP